MSDIWRPESATASLTAVSACAASGISAERVTFEYPTPLTAILQRFSHIAIALLLCQPELRQGDVVVQFLEDYLDPSPDLAVGVFRAQKVAGHQRAGSVVQFDDDAGVGHRRREALVAGVIHDRISVDRALAAHRLEFEVGGDALGAGRVRRVLEMPATLAALQFDHPAFRRLPERLRPLVGNGDRPGHRAPVTHGVVLAARAEIRLAHRPSP